MPCAKSRESAILKGEDAPSRCVLVDGPGAHIDPPAKPALPEAPLEVADAETATSPVGAAKLRVFTDAGPGKELPLTKAITTVGKPGAGVAAISRRPQGDFIVNVERSEGTKAPLVNGAPLGHRSVRLEHQDVIEIAGVKMEYLKE